MCFSINIYLPLIKTATHKQRVEQWLAGSYLPVLLHRCKLGGLVGFVMMVGETHRNASGNALRESSKASRATTETPEFKRSAVRNFSLKANPCYTKLERMNILRCI